LRKAAGKAKTKIVQNTKRAVRISKTAAVVSKNLSKQVAAKAKKHFSSFHALHSTLRMDRLDYIFKFSTELMVAGLTVMVAFFSVGGFHHLQAMDNDTGLSQIALAHPTNMALYAHANTSVAVIDHRDGDGLIQTASADENLDATASDQATIGENAEISDNTITNPTPDTVKDLITDQIKVYVTQPGDTISSIAATYNLSVNTIIWANNLSATQTIKPGWDLVILPTDGVLHKVTTNDTLPDIAKEFNANIDTIISYNNLADDDDINPGDLLIIPGGSVTPPPQPKPEIANKVTTKKGSTVTVYEPISDYGGIGHEFPFGECTYYVAKLRGGIPWGGNAKDWFANARGYGAKTGQMPEAGAIVVFHSARGENYSRYGHVAVVTSVSDNSFTITEMNYDGYDRTDTRTISDADAAITGFIY
jgi:surface antigen/LysM repeat protein